MKPYPLITRDPVTGEELTVTRLENRARGLVMEGEFSLGWIGALTFEQLEYAGLLLRCRGNVQKVADTLGVSYNTARSRLDVIVDALGGAADAVEIVSSSDDVLTRLERREIDFDAAMKLLKR